jgi:hypothetical protein
LHKRALAYKALIRMSSVVLPLLFTMNSVVVANEATLESWKRGVVPLFALATSRVASGDVVPMPTKVWMTRLRLAT